MTHDLGHVTHPAHPTHALTHAAPAPTHPTPAARLTHGLTRTWSIGSQPPAKHLDPQPTDIHDDGRVVDGMGRNSEDLGAAHRAVDQVGVSR